jgi:hypothetical protein
VELLTLGVIAVLILAMNRFELQDHWTACRLGAEQLRIARMSLPLLVMPSALAIGDKPLTDGHGGEIEYGVRGLAEAKRAIRTQGLPRLDRSLTPRSAADWVSLIVADQIVYHRRNHAQLEHAEHRVLILTRALFGIAVVSVLVHFVHHADWLLLGTAAGPAFAASLHGAGTRLGITHRAALSKQMEMALEKVEESLKTVTAAEQDWPKVRRLTFQAAEEMGGENNSWRSLVRRYRDELV